MDELLTKKCMHYREGLCYYIGSSPERCESICWEFISFDEDLINTVNERIRKRRQNKSLRMRQLKNPSKKTQILKDDKMNIKKGPLNIDEDIDLKDILVPKRGPVERYHINLAYGDSAKDNTSTSSII